MGLDFDFKDAVQPDSGALEDKAEAAIQAALSTGSRRIAFGTAAALKGRDADVEKLCVELQKKYPRLAEIVPNRDGDGASIYLDRKPSAARKFLMRFAPNDI
jgi:hypothetical protein